MRYVPRNCIQPDAVLAKPILGINGEILLQDGVKMRENYIRRMEKLGIPGAYVHDPLSEDVEIVTALSDELKAQAVKNISSCFSKITKGQALSRASAAAIMKTAEQIVDEILNQGDVMLNLLDLKVYDSYTYYHCVNVTVLSVVLGLGMRYPREKLVNLAYAALLHDVGKVFIDPVIINKPGALTPDEFEEIKRHPAEGYAYIKEHYPATVPEVVAMGVLDHHERVDGTGYPSGKAGSAITTFGRIISVADVYDALISDRPYRKGLFALDAMEYVQGGAGTLFDFEIVHAFSRKVALFPVGTCVLLSNGAIGLVLENFEGLTQRPLLRIFEECKLAVEPYELDLSKEAFDLTIVSTVEM